MKEFVDIDRPISLEYFDVRDSMDENDVLPTIKKVLKLIEKDAHYMDSYLLLSDLYRDSDEEQLADKYLNVACMNSLELIMDENGQWPDKLEWGWIENRHILKALFTKAEDYWIKDQIPQASALMQKLLKSNPKDHLGVRYVLLAILEGLAYMEFKDRFDRNGFYNDDIVDWFKENIVKYPDEIGWWMG